MSAIVVPTILAENSDQYKQSVERIQPFAERVHIDICDGEFAPSFTINPNEAYWPANWHADVHAMVARPSEYVAQLIALKANLVIFHAEVEEDLTASMQQLQAAGIKAGVALQRSTVPELVRPYVELADHVMIFSGSLGHYGGVASMMQLEKVRLIRAIKPNVEIGWDGGVTVENAFSLAQGGIDVLNVGGTIAKSNNPQATYGQLVSEINKHSVI